jgi:hypothetical protein
MAMDDPSVLESGACMNAASAISSEITTVVSSLLLHIGVRFHTVSLTAIDQARS